MAHVQIIKRFVIFPNASSLFNSLFILENHYFFEIYFLFQNLFFREKMKLFNILLGVGGLVGAAEQRPEMTKVDYQKVYIENPIDVMPTSREGGWTGVGLKIFRPLNTR